MTPGHGFARGFAAEVGKGLLTLLAGWRALLVQMITFPLFYLLIVLFMGRGEPRADLLAPVLLGMVALTFVHEQVNRVFWSYLGDIQSGVLEQTYLTPLPSAGRSPRCSRRCPPRCPSWPPAPSPSPSRAGACPSTRGCPCRWPPSCWAPAGWPWSCAG
ncbi:hypothetical protein [Actinomadura kijaniata]|uniref:hypothetical protein n=1 Tax=Actinomadura kijaniata TaxID=46161 RepID=UPI001C3F1B88|nr:hypothetical protein [Actinomadura kijaniata]